MPARAWSVTAPGAPPEALDLLSKMITWSPDKRLTVTEAMQHPYFAAILEEEDLHVTRAACPLNEQELCGIARQL